MQGIIVGITNETNPNCLFMGKWGQISYAHVNRCIYANSWKLKGGYHSDKTNMRVKMELNLEKAELIFFIDDKPDPIIIKDIKKGDDLKYRMFISMYYKDDFVEIINFSKQ